MSQVDRSRNRVCEVWSYFLLILVRWRWVILWKWFLSSIAQDLDLADIFTFCICVNRELTLGSPNPLDSSWEN